MTKDRRAASLCDSSRLAHHTLLRRRSVCRNLTHEFFTTCKVIYSFSIWKCTFPDENLVHYEENKIVIKPTWNSFHSSSYFLKSKPHFSSKVNLNYLTRLLQINYSSFRKWCCIFPVSKPNFKFIAKKVAFQSNYANRISLNP